MRSQDRVQTEKQKLVAELKSLEVKYRQLKKLGTDGQKLATFDELWDIFGTSVTTPDAAPFVIGRLYQAFKPYREALKTISKYEGIEAKLAEIAKLEDDIKKIDQPGPQERPSVQP